MIITKYNKKEKINNVCTQMGQIRIECLNNNNEVFKLYPCCVCRDMHFNYIGEITKDDIINNNVFNKILSAYKNISHNDFLSERCKHFLLKNIDYKRYYCNWNDFPLRRINVSIQQTCNLQCTMCRPKIYKNQEVDELYFKVLEQLKGHNLDVIELTQRGEPFYYKERTLNYLNSLKYLEDCRCITIISNLTLLNDDDLLMLKSIKDKGFMIYLVASIDGITAETYGKIRCNKLFDKVMHNALKLKEYDILHAVNFVIQDDNIHELLEAYEYWHNIVGIQFNGLPINHDNIAYNNKIEQTDEYKKFLSILS